MSNELVQRVPFSVMISKPSYQKLINNTIKDPAKVSRFVAAITSAVAVNPALQECDAATILSGALLGESLNLSPSPQLGQYYLVPYDNKKKGCKDAVFQIGYKGLVQLAMRSGQYRRINVISVKEGELVGWDPLMEDYRLEIISSPLQRRMAKTIGYLAFFEYLNGFTKTIYWSKEEMIDHADTYSPAFNENATTIKTKKGTINKVSFADYEAGNYPEKDSWLYSSFWYKNFDMMAHKTMLRQLISKWGVMSIELQTAFDGDGAIVNDGEYIHVEEAQLPSPATEMDFSDLEPETAVELDKTENSEKQVSMSDI